MQGMGQTLCTLGADMSPKQEPLDKGEK